MDVFQRASNAKFNKDKTVALSLSGDPQPTWDRALRELGFPACHDRTHPDPVIYLGYLLSSSRAQLHTFMERMLETIHNHCNIHLGRGLSIRGRATILNTLILSKLWHVLCIIGAPRASFHNQLKSIIGNFLMHRMFPRVAYSTLCLPRRHGGVGLLDPITQQNALQLRWIKPMLEESGTYPQHI
ncbi:hypothetical protein BJV82DRAFT_563341, partial [Fennellomyces sp. T-0311]